MKVRVTRDMPCWMRDVYEVELPDGTDESDIKMLADDAIAAGQAVVVVEDRYMDNVLSLSTEYEYEVIEP